MAGHWYEGSAAALGRHHDYDRPADSETDAASPLQKSVLAVEQEALSYRALLLTAIYPMEQRGLNAGTLKELLKWPDLALTERQPLEVMDRHFPALVGLRGGTDFTADSVRAVTKLHLEEKHDLLLADAARKYATDNFGTIDVDHDGVLGSAELYNRAAAETGDNKLLATYLADREVDVASLSPDPKRDFITRKSELERGISRDDLKAMTATAMTDAAISNLYLSSRLEQGNMDVVDKAIGIWIGRYYDSRGHADVKAFLKELPSSEYVAVVR